MQLDNHPRGEISIFDIIMLFVESFYLRFTQARYIDILFDTWEYPSDLILLLFDQSD